MKKSHDIKNLHRKEINKAWARIRANVEYLIVAQIQIESEELENYIISKKKKKGFSKKRVKSFLDW